MLTSGGSSLGWSGTAAIGVKLAHPDRAVISPDRRRLVPALAASGVHWMVRRYNSPLLTMLTAHEPAAWTDADARSTRKIFHLVAYNMDFLWARASPSA